MAAPAPPDREAVYAAAQAAGHAAMLLRVPGLRALWRVGNWSRQTTLHVATATYADAYNAIPGVPIVNTVWGGVEEGTATEVETVPFYVGCLRSVEAISGLLPHSYLRALLARQSNTMWDDDAWVALQEELFQRMPVAWHQLIRTDPELRAEAAHEAPHLMRLIEARRDRDALDRSNLMARFNTRFGADVSQHIARLALGPTSAPLPIRFDRQHELAVLAARATQMSDADLSNALKRMAAAIDAQASAKRVRK